jgi:hypothetical protein
VVRRTVYFEGFCPKCKKPGSSDPCH